MRGPAAPGRKRRWNERPLLLFAIAVALVLAATLVPTGSEDVRGLTDCLICGSRGTSDAVLNVLLFLPVGAAAGLVAGSGLAIAALASPLLASLVETAQLFLPGRDPSVADLLLNTLGGTLGLLWVRRHRRARSHPPRGPRGAWLPAAIVSALLLGGALLLSLQPPGAVYYGQWTPELGHLETYAGTVLSARLGSVEVPIGPHPETDALRRAIGAGVSLEVDVVAGPAPPSLAPIFSIYDRREREVLLLGADGPDLVFRVRRRAAALRVDQPDARLAGGLAGAGAGDTLRLQAFARPDGELCLSVHPGSSSCGLGPTLARSWAFLLYPEVSGGAGRWFRRGVDLLWVSALFGIVGLGAARSSSAASFSVVESPAARSDAGSPASKKRRGRRPGLVLRLSAAAFPVLVLWMVPYGTAAAATPPWVLAAAAAAVLLGWLTGARFRRGGSGVG